MLLLWLALLVGATLGARTAGSDYSNQLSLPGTPSTRAVSLLQAASPKVSGDTERVVFEASRSESMPDPSIKARVEQTLTRLSRVPHVTTIVSPYSASGASQISSDKKIAFATITFDEQGQLISVGAAKHFVEVAQSGDEPGLQVAVSGVVAENANGISLGGAGFGLLLAAIVLFLVFGSLLAMSLPLVSVLASLGAAIGVVDLLSHAITIPTFSSQLTLLIGLGVGVDYALFIITRHRQGLLAGRDVESAVVAAIDTSGRAVLFAGSIVCIALLGMLALGVSFLSGLAVGAAVGVAATVLAALTLLPALLGFIGPRVLSRRQRRNLAADGPAEAPLTGFWSRWALFLQRRPVVPLPSLW